MHTVESVKAELPEVKIMVNGEVVTGTISGRLLKFPWVTTDSGYKFEFSWATIVHCLNKDTYLLT